MNAIILGYFYMAKTKCFALSSVDRYQNGAVKSFFFLLKLPTKLQAIVSVS